MEKEKFLKYVNKKRKKIPKRYNQIKLIDELQNDKLDHYISISNRADGKSYNYTKFLLDFAIDHEIGFILLVRHYTVRMAGVKLLEKIIDTSDDYDPYNFEFMRTDFYIVLIYKDREIGIITDLNQATDLKYQSNYLENFPIMLYDEFLALEGDYLPDEWEKLRTIYGSVNRKEEIPIIKTPKIFYLGNAVNFSSPVLANLNMFNILERHKINTMNTYDNIVLELNKNTNANEIRNLRAFNEKIDPMSYAQFKVNNHNIATDEDKNRINKSPSYVYIKLVNNYLKITYNNETYESMLSIISFNTDYQFNYLIKDNTSISTFLDETYYDDEHDRKHVKGRFLYDNNFSRDFILETLHSLKFLKINKVIKAHKVLNTLDNFEKREEIYKENYIENTKKSLVKKFLQ